MGRARRKHNKANTSSQNLLKTPNVANAVKDELLKEAEADPKNPLFNLEDWSSDEEPYKGLT